MLTGTPDQSEQNTLGPMFQPVADAVDKFVDASRTIAAVAGKILPNPLRFLPGLGAIVSSDGNNSRTLDAIAPNGSLVGNPIGGPGTPCEMPGTSNPNQAAEDFAKQAFGARLQLL